MRNMMLMAITTLMLANCNANTRNEWMKDYGMTPCDNPVFIAPERTVPGGRVRGAGINMNDGEAYSSNYIGFSTEWHYAPKIDISKVEKEQWYRIAGEKNAYLLKFSVKQINDCGAAVIYRDTQARRDEPNLGQVLVTFNASGEVIDIMTTGTFYDMEEVLELANTGSYTNKPNMGGRHMEYTSDSTFTIFNYYYYTKNGEGTGTKWNEERDYLIDKDGNIHLITILEENRPQSLDIVWKLRDLSMSPTSQLLETLDMLTLIKTEVSGNEKLNEWYDRILEQQIKRNIPQFLVWNYNHKYSEFGKKIDSIIMNSINPEKDDIKQKITSYLNRIEAPEAHAYWQKEFLKLFPFLNEND